MLHRINDGASNVDSVWILTLFDEIISGELCRSEVVLTYDSHSLTIKFFWTRTGYAISSQASFNMAHRYLEIETGKSGHEGSGCVRCNTDALILIADPFHRMK